MILYTLPYAAEIMQSSTIEELKSIVDKMPKCDRDGCNKPAMQDHHANGNYCSSWCIYLEK